LAFENELAQAVTALICQLRGGLQNISGKKVMERKHKKNGFWVGCSLHTRRGNQLFFRFSIGYPTKPNPTPKTQKN
jgi:hypothetical protein